MKKITVRAFTRALRKAVRQKGENYVNETCSYRVSTDEGVVPGCIIGQALFNLDPALLQEIHEGPASIRLPQLPVTFEEDLLDAASVTQGAQDAGRSWGEALDVFYDATDRKPRLRRRIRAFLLGVREFRSGLTTHFSYPLIGTYDKGREFAHRVTFRKFDINR